MPNKRNITVGAKVDREYARLMKEKAKAKGESLGAYIREALAVNDKLEEIGKKSNKEISEIIEWMENGT